MRGIVFVSVVALALMSGHVHCQCAFKAPGLQPRHDQYSMSTDAVAKKSQKEMAKQQDEFDKPKYQATVKINKNAAKKRKTIPRYS
jgi:hypothetical protein